MMMETKENKIKRGWEGQSPGNGSERQGVPVPI